MKATILIIFILGFQNLYSQLADKYFDANIKVDKQNIPIDNEQFYFPLEFFRYTNSFIGHDTLVNKWYSKHLYALKEPLLFNKQIEKTIYRFTWLRTFHNPISIRLEKEGEDYRLFWKVCDGAGGYEPGELKINKSKKIKKRDGSKFNSLLLKCNFWDIDIGECPFDGDGSEWILEGNDGKNYKVINQWSLEKGAFYDVCNFLIELTNLKIKKRNKY